MKTETTIRKGTVYSKYSEHRFNNSTVKSCDSTLALPKQSCVFTVGGKNYTKGMTHAGSFHADDVFATALIRCLHHSFIPVRTNDYHLAETAADDILVYDIGGGKFDHHQKDRKVREDGTPYAAFGLLWPVVGKDLGFSDIAIQKFDREFVCNIDRHDNTGCGNSIAYAISSMNNEVDTFMDAVSLATGLMVSMLYRLHRFDESIEFAKSRIDPRHPSWVDMIDSSGICHRCDYFAEESCPTRVLAIITKSKRMGYCVTSITDRKNGKTSNRYLFPKEYRGLSEDELKHVAHGIGMTFCHPSGFMAIFERYDQATYYCEKNIKEEKRNEI